MKVEKSICSKFVRITINGVATVITTEAWSYAIGHNAEFAPSAADWAKAVGV